ncbi:PadR family transcriptional regulator [bacterium]|nr:PadR family transcriptional regulator [bacterium]
MLETMILFTIWDWELSMYSIMKRIHEVFGDFSTPSLGAIKPCLTKLENLNCIKSRKTLSDGGKLTGYYSITSEGKKMLKNLLFEDLSSNPVNFKSACAVKIIVSEILPKEQQSALFSSISRKVELNKISAEKKLKNERNLKPYQRIMIDNLVLEYDNFLKLTEQLGK